MVIAVCAGVLLVAWLALESRQKDLKHMDPRDLPRLRLLSERMKRRDIYPFE